MSQIGGLIRGTASLIKAMPRMAKAIENTHKKKVANVKTGHQYFKNGICRHCSRRKESIYLVGGKCKKR